MSSSDFDLVIFHAWQNWATDLGLPVLTDISGKKLVFSHCISTNTIFPTRPFRSTIRYLTWRPYWWKLPKWIRALDGVVFLAKDGVGDRFDDLKLAHELGVATYHVPNMGQSFASKLRRGAEERTSILSVGSYDWFKGFDFVIRAYAASSAKNSLPLKLFGQKFTSYTKKLRVLAANLGIDSAFMEFNERLSGPELLECYQTARIFVCGSHSECQPLAILDAMASGAPFVARSTGCIGSLRGGIAVRTEKEAGQAISMLINEVSIWEELQSEGMQSAVREFSYSALQGALLDLVEKVCGKGA